MDIGTLLKSKRKELKLSVKQVVDSLKSYNISISEKLYMVGKTIIDNQMQTHF